MKEEELYDSKKDLGETNNLAAEHPELVAELRALTQNLPKTEKEWSKR